MEVNLKHENEVMIDAKLVSISVRDYGNEVVIQILGNDDIRLGTAEIRETEIEMTIQGRWA